MRRPDRTDWPGSRGRAHAAGIAIAALAAALAVSLLANVHLLRTAETEMVASALVREDPLAMSRYAAANKALAPKEPGRARVVFIGDSRIERWSELPRVDAAEVVNRGVSGQSSAQLLGRLPQDAVLLDPDVVVVEVGVNDLVSLGVVPGRSAALVEACLRNVAAIVERLRERDIGVVLLSVFPTGPVGLTGRPFWSSEIDDAIARLNRGLAAIRREGVTFFDCAPVLTDGSSGLRDGYAVDSLHLSPAAYTALSAGVEPLLLRLTQRRRAGR